MGKPSISFSLLSVIILSVLWKPVYSEDKCSAGCTGSSSGQTFAPGQKYNYGVEGEVTIYLTGADKQETSVKLAGQVSVSALGNCAHVLKIQDLTIYGPDGKKYGKPVGLEKPVRFILQDGRTGPDICAEEGDTRRSLNIKRAIISLLQTEQKASNQVDVFGICPTDASFSQEGSAVLIHRSRDLSQCAHREQGQNGLISAVYNPTAEIKNTLVLQSTLNVETKVNNGVPEKIFANEEYLYKPFSVGENGARARVYTKLTLSGKGGGADNGQFKEARTIIFEAPHGTKMERSNFQSAVTAVKDTARTLATEASSQSAASFIQVVRVFRTTSKEDLVKVFNQVKGNSLEKRVFLDALLRSGTGYSIEASIQILKSKELSNLEQQLVFLSLGNAKHVNDEALKAASTLVDLPNVPKEIYLGVGALAGTYCREHSCHSGESDGITALSQKLGSKLQNCKPKTKTDEDFLIAVLKGIRNIRHIEDSLVDKLIHCAADNGVQARVKVAALEAYHADPCSPKLKKSALDIMKNRQLDSEIRIKAYLAVIACPCGKSANEIKNLLESEPVHQVGRFITTSLRHIRSSANPDKLLARQHYGLIRTPNKFNVDDRKYSFYREASYNVDALGVGGNLEETVIYSQNSFIPRSVSLNLTTEIFGHNLNVFEVGGRQGNLDRVVEHFLGPKSFVRNNDPQSIYDALAARWNEIKEKTQKSRGRRSLKSEVDSFDKRVKAEAEPYNNELDLDIYVKLFGTDAIFLSLGDDKGFDFNKVLDQILEVTNDGLDKLKNFQQEVRSHLLFLDAELTYPTSTGFPLKLILVGAATGRLEVSSKIDIQQILRNPQNAKLDIELIPSSDIEIAGLFIVDADSIATGLKVSNNLHSSTGGHLIAKMVENGHGIDIQFALPVDKQEILTASNEIYYVTAEKGQKGKLIPVKVDSERKEYSECFDQLSGVLGLTLCGEISIPFSVTGPEAQSSISNFIARYPLTGQSKIKLVLEKNDLKGYHVKGVLNLDNPQRQNFELLFEAEGSQNRRSQLVGELVNNNEEKTVKLSLESPIKTISGQISLFTKSNEYAALLKAQYDKSEYYARAGFNVQGDARRSVFLPVIEYQFPGEQGRQSVRVDGQLTRETSDSVVKYTIDGIKVNLPNSNEVIHINGNLKQEQRNIEVDLKAKKGEHNLLLSGSLKGNDAKLEFQNTLNPYINFKVDGHFEFGETIHNEIDIYYGGDLQDSQNRVTFSQFLKYHKASPEDISVISKNKFEIHALPLKVKLDAELDSKKIDIDMEGVYLEKKANFELEARSQIKKPGDYSVKIKAFANKQGVEVFAKRDIVSPEKSNMENYIVVKNVGKYELSGVVLHKLKPNDMNVGANGHLKVTSGSKTEDIRFDIGVIETSNLYSSHAKVTGTKGQLVDYLLKVTSGPNASGELKLILKDTITANGQFKIVDKDGKGNGAIIVEFKKVQRKIKGEAQFLVKDPVYNAEVDVYLNFEQDNSDKVHFSTKSKLSEKLIESKNTFDYAGKKIEVNVHQDGVLSTIGKTNANVEVVLPSNRCLNFKLNRDFTEKDDVYNGQAQVILSDAASRGGPASTISYSAKVLDTNFETDAINYEGQIDVKLTNGKQLQNSFFIKNTPQGEKSKFEFKTDVTGNILPKPASLSGTMDYDNDNSIIDENSNYVLKGNYGSDISFDVTGVAELHLLEKGEKKYVDDSTITLRLPYEDAHDIKIVSTYIYTVPEGENSLFEYTVVESVQVNGEIYKVDASGQLGPKNGQGKIKLVVPHADPFSLDTNYKADLESDKKTANIELKALYGKGKATAVIIDIGNARQENNLRVRITAPQDVKVLGIGQKLDVKLISKNLAPDTYSSSLTVDADGRPYYKSDSQVILSKAHPLIDVKYTLPQASKPSRVYLKGTSLSSNQNRIEVRLENVRDISFDAASEANIEKDSISLKVTANSNELGLKNFKGDISSKDSGNGKRLEFHVTNENQNVVSGSTSFISKQEGPKMIIEGSGSVKVKDEQKSANFKYIRTLLTEGNEQGIETFLNLAIGERSYVGESRVTNLEYKTSYVYCEEKKQCAHAELNSKINVQKAGALQYILTMGLDLRKLGFAPEFGLEAVNEVSEDKLPQFKLDVHINKEDKKYHLHLYSQPEYGKLPAGITVTLPQRVLALESLVSYPTDRSLPFPVKGELVFHLDKNKPQQKTALRFLVDVAGDSNQNSAVAELGFTHPKLGKEALVRFRNQVQRPDQNTYKIETTASVSHSTLGGQRESKMLLEVNPVHIKLLVNTPILQVIDLEGSVELKDNLQQGELKFSLIECKPVQIRAVAKDFQYYEFTTGYSDENERKLSIIGHLEPEKRVDISADIILSGEKKNIIHGALYLQDNLVKSDYGISKENFNYFINTLKTDLSTLEAQIKEIGEKGNNEFKNIMRRVEPTLKQLDQSYKDELEKLYKELADDKVLEEISRALYDIYKFVATIISDFLEVTQPLADKISEIVKESAKEINNMYEKKIEAQVKELYQNVAAVIKAYLDGLIDVVAHFAALFTDFFEKHKAELEELTNTIAEIFKDLTRLVVAQLKEFRGKVIEIIAAFNEQIKQLPIIDMIKEKYQELQVPDQLIGVLETAHRTIRELLPTEETKNFADVVYGYVTKKLRQDKMDEMAELRVVYEKFAVALVSLVQFVRQQLNQFGVPSLINVNSVPLISGPSTLPSFGGLASFSILNQFIKGDVPDALDVLKAYRPRSLNPLDEIPAKLRAVVVNGQHIFTFDGRHLTFPGNCRYVLVHDFVDRNFTLSIQLQNGQPNTLILEDKSGDIIELKDNGQVKLNGANHGFPVIQKDVFAFRQANGRLGLGSLYGLMVFCQNKLEVCYIEVSGFYLGKLRGLLGDGNNEPFDDFTMPNGRIVTSESEFGHAYRLATSCPQPKTPEHSAHQHHAALPAACEKVFGASSLLRPLALVLDVSPFRQACIHAVTADSANALKQACDLGRGYAALAVSGLLPALLPADCVRCTDADSPKELGDTYDLKLPGKLADIVVTVETTKDNEKNFKDIAIPMVAQLIAQLKAKKIEDIKLYLVGITSKFPYPIVYDTDLRLSTPKIKFDDESRYEKPPYVKTGYESFDKYEKTVIDILEDLRISLGLTNVVAGYGAITDLPFRPGAVKHAIHIVGSVCKKQIALIELLRSIAYREIKQQSAYTTSLVTVTPDLTIGGGKNPKQVIGWSEEGVLILGDKKKGKDSESLLQSLSSEPDSCVDFMQSTGGYVFSATNFHGFNPQQQKQFLHTSVNAIIGQMFKENLVQSCGCVYTDPFTVSSVCINKERKEISRKRK